MRAHDALLQSMRLFRSIGTTDNEQLMHAYSLMLSSSIDTSIIPHVLTVVEPGASSRFSARYTSSAVLYLSELYIHRCAAVATGMSRVYCGTRVYNSILFNIIT
jgi:hypothetical protein